MLTAVQHKTYQFIKSFIQQHGYSPTTAEVAKGIGIKSRGVVYRYLLALVETNKIKLIPNRRRNIQLTQNKRSPLPLLGTIAAGSPIEAVAHQETIDVLDMFLGPDRFALKVKGNSMIEDGIIDGDIIVCQRSDTAENHQIVVALIDNEYATLKRLRRNSNDSVTLLPANSKHKALVYSADRVKIQGVFVGLLRYQYVT